MDFVVSPLTTVNFAPATELEEILQNVATILATRKGTVPLDRNFGLDWSFMDMPMTPGRGIGMVTMSVIKALHKYEPRCQVKKVEFKEDTSAAADGVLVPVVTIEVSNNAA